MRGGGQTKSFGEVFHFQFFCFVLFFSFSISWFQNLERKKKKILSFVLRHCQSSSPEWPAWIQLDREIQKTKTRQYHLFATTCCFQSNGETSPNTWQLNPLPVFCSTSISFSYRIQIFVFFLFEMWIVLVWCWCDQRKLTNNLIIIFVFLFFCFF